MDIVYFIAAGLGWAAVLGLACACQRLQHHKVAP